MVKNCICNPVQFLTIKNDITAVLPILYYIYIHNFNKKTVKFCAIYKTYVWVCLLWPTLLL
jgi:hypothetical protein